MKKFIYSVIFLFICNAANSQQKLHDGVYLVDKFKPDSYHPGALNKSLISFNESFIEEDPEEYSPLLINTGDFVPFEFSIPPITQIGKRHNKILFLKLTDSASEKLKVFTTKNMKRYVVIVVNSEAITVHKIKEPVTSGLIQIATANDNIYERLYWRLKSNVKELYNDDQSNIITSKF